MRTHSRTHARTHLLTQTVEHAEMQGCAAAKLVTALSLPPVTQPSLEPATRVDLTPILSAQHHAHLHHAYHQHVMGTAGEPVDELAATRRLARSWCVMAGSEEWSRAEQRREQSSGGFRERHGDGLLHRGIGSEHLDVSLGASLGESLPCQSEPLMAARPIAAQRGAKVRARDGAIEWRSSWQLAQGSSGQVKPSHVKPSQAKPSQAKSSGWYLSQGGSGGYKKWMSPDRDGAELILLLPATHRRLLVEYYAHDDKPMGTASVTVQALVQPRAPPQPPQSGTRCIPVKGSGGKGSGGKHGGGARGGAMVTDHDADAAPLASLGGGYAYAHASTHASRIFDPTAPVAGSAPMGNASTSGMTRDGGDEMVASAHAHAHAAGRPLDETGAGRPFELITLMKDQRLDTKCHTCEAHQVGL